MGQRHKCYLKEHRKATYAALLTSGNLNSCLADIDGQAEKMFSRLVKQMAEREGVTEQLKAENQLEWVQRMNNICSRVTEIVNTDLIYTQLTAAAVNRFSLPPLLFCIILLLQ